MASSSLHATRTELDVQTGVLKTPTQGRVYLLRVVPAVKIQTKNPSLCLLAQGAVHSQLRHRTSAMLETLERASFAAQEQKTRKTSSGRTFVEQAAVGTA